MKIPVAAFVAILLASGLPSPASAFATTQPLHLASPFCHVYLPPIAGLHGGPTSPLGCSVEADAAVTLVGCSAGTCSVRLDVSNAVGASALPGVGPSLAVYAQQESGPGAHGVAAQGCRVSTTLGLGPLSCQGSAVLVVDGLVSDECQTFRVAAVYIASEILASASATSVFMLCVDGAGAASVFAHAPPETA